MRDRFTQAGRNLVARYDIPKSMEAMRDPFVNQVDISRQVIQHFEMLANCAEFAPGQDGADCHNKLLELMDELATDNLAAGIMCQGDIPSASNCDQPQQFMQAALMYLFFHRIYSNYGDVGGLLEQALIDGPRIYYEQGMDKLPDGVTPDLNGVWAALLSCPLSGGMVGSCTRLQNGDGDLLAHNKPHTLAMLLMADALDPGLGYCDLVRAVYDDPSLPGFWSGTHFNAAGWWKGVDQMMQGAVFGVGLYDTCGVD
jgi:hypothetical protein